MALRITPRRVEKPWGDRELPPPFFDLSDGRQPIGEIIFEAPVETDSQLLVKFLFTSEKLSIQVHPGDEIDRDGARARGKDEAWLVLAAEPGASIGLGLTRVLTKEALRRAALDGELEALVHWRLVQPDDAYYSPAGTIHTIGAGISLLEIQQNVDATYRLYDYGRPRELHVDLAVAAARPGLSPCARGPIEIAPGRTSLAGGPAFQMERLSGAMAGRLSPPDRELWLVALTGKGAMDGEPVKAGEVWRLDGPCNLQVADGGTFIITYPGSEAAPVWQENRS